MIFPAPVGLRTYSGDIIKNTFLTVALCALACCLLAPALHASTDAVRVGAYGTYASVAHGHPALEVSPGVYDVWNIERQSGYSVGIMADAFLFSIDNWMFRAALRTGYGSYPGRRSRPGGVVKALNGFGTPIPDMVITHTTSYTCRLIDVSAGILVLPFGSGLGFTVGPELGVPQDVSSQDRTEYTGREPEPRENAPDRKATRDGDIWYFASRKVGHTADYGVRIGVNVGVSYEFAIGSLYLVPRMAYSQQLNDYGNDMNTFDAIHAGLDVMIAL